MSWKHLALMSIAVGLCFGPGALVRAQEAQEAQAKPATVPTEPARFTAPFPAATLTNLHLDAGPNKIDLALTLGQKPIVLVYWIPGNPRADKLLQDVQEIVLEAGLDKIAMFAVSYQAPGRGPEVARGRARELQLKVPVLDDEGFVLGQRLRVQSVPSIALIDGKGMLRLANGASLYQGLEYQMNMESAIRRLARTGGVGTYGYLAPYHPVNELVGKKCPDFEATFLGKSEKHNLSTLLAADKVNVLIFWSVDCPHCIKSLPEFNTWLRANGEGLNVISAAKVTSEATKIRTREFCDVSEFVFPTIADWDLKISHLYQVTSTPTFLIIGPDGIIDSVMLSGYSDFATTLLKKKQRLLKKS